MSLINSGNIACFPWFKESFRKYSSFLKMDFKIDQRYLVLNTDENEKKTSFVRINSFEVANDVFSSIYKTCYEK